LAKIIYSVQQRTNRFEFFAKAKVQLNDYKQQAETIIDSQNRCWTRMEKRSGDTLKQRVLGSNPSVSTMFSISGDDRQWAGGTIPECYVNAHYGPHARAVSVIF
jgi:hypothetical protein